MELKKSGRKEFHTMAKKPAKYKIVIPGKQPIYRNDFGAAIRAATEAQKSSPSVTIRTWDEAKQSYVNQ
jgi:hypothetical protein